MIDSGYLQELSRMGKELQKTEGKWMHGNYMLDAAEKLRALSLAPAQQPLTQAAEPRYLYDEDEGMLHDPGTDHPDGCIPLYTAPQRHPLTDEQLGVLMMHTWGCASIAPRDAPAFARAIEAAHGITGEQK